MNTVWPLRRREKYVRIGLSCHRTTTARISRVRREERRKGSSTSLGWQRIQFAPPLQSWIQRTGNSPRLNARHLGLTVPSSSDSELARCLSLLLEPSLQTNALPVSSEANAGRAPPQQGKPNSRIPIRRDAPEPTPIQPLPPPPEFRAPSPSLGQVVVSPLALSLHDDRNGYSPPAGTTTTTAAAQLPLVSTSLIYRSNSR